MVLWGSRAVRDCFRKLLVSWCSKHMIFEACASSKHDFSTRTRAVAAFQRNVKQAVLRCPTISSLTTNTSMMPRYLAQRLPLFQQETKGCQMNHIKGHWLVAVESESEWTSFAMYVPTNKECTVAGRCIR